MVAISGKRQRHQGPQAQRHRARGRKQSAPRRGSAHHRITEPVPIVTAQRGWRPIEVAAATGIVLPHIPVELRNRVLHDGPLHLLAPLLSPDDEAITPEGFCELALRKFVSHKKDIGIDFTLSEQLSERCAGENGWEAGEYGVACDVSLDSRDIGTLLDLPKDLAEGLCYFMGKLDEVLSPATYMSWFEQRDWRGDSNEWNILFEHIQGEDDKVSELMTPGGKDRDCPKDRKEWEVFYQQLSDAGYESPITKWIDATSYWPEWMINPKECDLAKLADKLRAHDKALGDAVAAAIGAKLPSEKITFTDWYDRFYPYSFIGWVDIGDNRSPLAHSFDDFDNYIQQGNATSHLGAILIDDNIKQVSATAKQIANYYERITAVFDALATE